MLKIPVVTVDGSAVYTPDFLPKAEADVLLATLLADTPWQADEIRMYGRTLPVPRLVAWYGNHSYKYSGSDHAPLAWTAPLLDLKARAEELAQVEFNTVLLNLYRDGRDSVSWHGDNEAVLGPAPTIASISLGAARTFKLRHRAKQVAPVDVVLAHGSCLVMAGTLQRDWEHAIPKSARALPPRINLTFRWIV